MKFTKETAKKMFRTFIQTIVGYIAVNLAIVDFTADKEVIKSALIGLAISAVSAGMAAIMNLQKAENGEEMGGGRTRTTKLEDTFEAVLGAVYLDQGWEIARDYALRELAPEFENAELGKLVKDYKTMLQEVVQQRPDSTIAYELLEASGPDHCKHYVFAVKIDGKVCGKGEGPSKKEAEQRAAEVALKKLTKK